MDEMRRFEAIASMMLAAQLVLLGFLMFAIGQSRILGGLLAGGILGLANLVWMVGTARGFFGRTPSLRAMQVTGTIRFLAVALLFGGLLIIGRVNPIGATLGYGCFPIAAAMAGWRMLRPPSRAAG